MKDLTPILMGDPGTSPRRAPTERERIEPKVGTGHEQQRDQRIVANIFASPSGFERIYPTWRKARNAQMMFYAKGLSVSLRRNDDGTYTVRGGR